MQDTINHSGYVLIRRELQKEDSTKVARATVRFAYDFNCGDLVIHAYERIPEIDGTNAVVAYDFDNKPNRIYVYDLLSPYNPNWKPEVKKTMEGEEKYA